MDYLGNNDEPTNSDDPQPDAREAGRPSSQPGDRFVAAADKATREAYARLAEADLMRHIGSTERRPAVLEYAQTRQERQQ